MNPDFFIILCELTWDANLNGGELNWDITVMTWVTFVFRTLRRKLDLLVRN